MIIYWDNLEKSANDDQTIPEYIASNYVPSVHFARNIYWENQKQASGKPTTMFDYFSNESKPEYLSNKTHQTLKLGQGLNLVLDSSGVISVTHGYHTVDTYEGASVDYIEGIGGGDIGDIVVLQPESSARAIVVRHKAGLRIGSEFVMSNAVAKITLFKASTGWTALAKEANWP